MEKPAHKLPSEQVRVYEEATRRIKVLQGVREDMSKIAVVTLTFEGDLEVKVVRLIEHFQGVVSGELKELFKTGLDRLMEELIVKMVEEREKVYRE